MKMTLRVETPRGVGFRADKIIDILSSVPADADVLMVDSTSSRTMVIQYDHKPMHTIVPGNGEDDSR
jgi:hypothetical protein